MKSEGILGCLKHFPGHGDTATDSHHALPFIDKSEEELFLNELIPFKRLIQETRIDCIMSGHIMLPKLDNVPASLSSNIIEGLLRTKLKYDGAIITDALNMRSVYGNYSKGELEYKAFKAGNDILSFSQNLKEGFNRIDECIDEDRISKSVNRIFMLKVHSNIPFGTSTTPVFIPNSQLFRNSISKKAITEIKKESPNSCQPIEVLISVYKKHENSMFFPEGTYDYYNIFKANELKQLAKSTKGKHIVIAFYPPSYKPKDNFGVKKQLLTSLHRLADSNNSYFYLFGNPYSLRLFDYEKFNHVVIAYQDLPELEEAATDHLTGRLVPKGKLPILNDINI